MPESDPAKSRRRPIQERSRATVDAILQATAQVLEDVGFAKASTNKIARRAGVSVGSLYQYFPNKEALFRSLLEEHVLRQNGVISEMLQGPGASDPQALIRRGIEALVAAHRVQPHLHAVLLRQLGGVSGLADLLHIDQKAIGALQIYFSAHAGQLRPLPDPKLAAVIVVRSVEAVLHGALLEDPDRMRDPLLVNELCALVGGYLLPR